MSTITYSTEVEAADAVRKMLHSFIYEVKIFGDNSSTLEDFDGYKAVIVWEEGPHEWTFDDSTCVSIGNVLSGTGYWFSPRTHYSIGIYRETAGVEDEEEAYRSGVCEDAPCCGCCGTSVYGPGDTYYSGTGELYDDPSYEDYLNRY